MSLLVIGLILLAGEATTCPVDLCRCGLQAWNCDDSGLRRVPHVEDAGVLFLSLRRCLLRDLTDDDMTRLGDVTDLDVSNQRGYDCVRDRRGLAWPTVRVTGLCAVSVLFLFLKKKKKKKKKKIFYIKNFFYIK
jgi:hypothetical protein